MASGRKSKASQRQSQQKKEDRGIKRKRDQDDIAELQSKVDELVSIPICSDHKWPSSNNCRTSKPPNSRSSPTCHSAKPPPPVYNNHTSRTSPMSRLKPFPLPSRARTFSAQPKPAAAKLSPSSFLSSKSYIAPTGPSSTDSVQ